jgi:hypothetical protein
VLYYFSYRLFPRVVCDQRPFLPAYTFGESAKQKNIGDERRSETDVITGHGAIQTTYRCKQRESGRRAAPGRWVVGP